MNECIVLCTDATMISNWSAKVPRFE